MSCDHAFFVKECEACVATDGPSTVLVGAHHDAYQEFVAAAQALEAHHTAGAALTDRYRAALANLSRLAAGQTTEPRPGIGRGEE